MTIRYIFISRFFISVCFLLKISNKSDLYNEVIYHCSYLGQCIYEPTALVASFIVPGTHSHRNWQWSHADLINSVLSRFAQCKAAQPNTEMLLVIWNLAGANFKYSIKTGQAQALSLFWPKPIFNVYSLSMGNWSRLKYLTTHSTMVKCRKKKRVIQVCCLFVFFFPSFASLFK